VPALVATGALISTFSSALGAVFGGSRLLQAVGRDRLFPGLHHVGVGSGAADEPRRAVIATWVIAQACLFIGDLSVVAPIITSFFMLSYAFTNLACFLLSVSGTPNFRPRFRYFSWHTALFGAILNTGMMFYLNAVYAGVSIAVMAALTIYLIVMPNPDTNSWGDVRQAIIFHQVRKFLLRLDQRHQHGKLWRPSILLVTDDPLSPLAVLCNALKKGGLYMIGSVVDKTTPISSWNRLMTNALITIEKSGLKAFPLVTKAESMRSGVQTAMMTAGLGALMPNTVVLALYNSNAAAPPPQSDDSGELPTLATFEGAEEYFDTLRDVLSIGKNLVVACNFESIRPDDVKPLLKKKIHIWLPGYNSIDEWDLFSGTSLLQIQLGYVLNRDTDGLFLFREVLNPSRNLIAERDLLVDVVKRQARFRIGKAGSQIVVVRSAQLDELSPQHDDPDNDDADDDDVLNTDDEPRRKRAVDSKNTDTPLLASGRNASSSSTGMLLNSDGNGGVPLRDVIAEPVDAAYWRALNQLVKCNMTRDTGLVILPLPSLTRFGDAEALLRTTATLVKDLGPVLLIVASENEVMSTTL